MGKKEVRNIKETQLKNVYNCEVNHPEFGWIPFTASPDDTVEEGRSIHAQIVEAKEARDIAILPYDGPSLEEQDTELFRQTAEVSEFQAKAALMQSDLLNDVLAYIDQADDMTKLAWETARVFKRNSYLINEVAEALEMKPEQMDDIFRFAMTIEV